MVFGPVGADDRPLRRGKPSVEGVFIADVFYATDLDFGEVSAGVENPVGRVG